MKNIGIFYHPAFRSRSYLTFRDRLRDFPEILNELLKKPNVRLCECPRAPVALILNVHTSEMVDQINREEQCGTAYESVGGVVAAMEALATGDLDGAFCFTGNEGHHAGYQEFWQSSCFNDVVIAITRVREISPWRRFAIVDTDAHHGGGTLNLIENDQDVLHLCFCRGSYHSGDEKVIEVDVYRQQGPGDNNANYLDPGPAPPPFSGPVPSRPAHLVFRL
jgi:acetoin utilization deacetylase AcuC-like enzyme